MCELSKKDSPSERASLARIFKEGVRKKSGATVSNTHQNQLKKKVSGAAKISILVTNLPKGGNT